MKKVFYFLIAMLAMVSCAKEHSIVGKWVSVVQDNENGKSNMGTIVESFSADGKYVCTISYQSGMLGGDSQIDGTYELEGDSMTITAEKATLLGMETSINGNKKSGRKIIELTEKTIIFENEKGRHEMTKIE